MKRNINHEQVQQLVSHLPKPPKRTKEQKVICKALDYISYAQYSSNRAVRDAHLKYACGLLEALLFQDDKEEE